MPEFSVWGTQKLVTNLVGYNHCKIFRLSEESMSISAVFDFCYHCLSASHCWFTHTRGQVILMRLHSFMFFKCFVILLGITIFQASDASENVC